MTQSAESAISPRNYCDFAYAQLRRLAQLLICHEQQCTLTATALVHELFLKLRQQKSDLHCDSSEIPPFAARMMKQLLIDRARSRSARRNAENSSLALDENSCETQKLLRARLIELDDAISRLAHALPENAELVRLHVYSELSIEEAARVLKMSRAAAYRKWVFSKAWLVAELRS